MVTYNYNPKIERIPLQKEGISIFFQLKKVRESQPKIKKKLKNSKKKKYNFLESFNNKF